MTCIKTGAHVYFAEHRTYAICDIHEFDGEFWVLRVTPTFIHTPIRKIIHAKINHISEEWSGNPHTMVVCYADRKYYGYEGKPIDG